MENVEDVSGFKFFQVTSLCREDFHSIGYEAAFLSDDDMERAAQWIEESLLDTLYWQVLRDFAQHYQLPKFIEKEVNTDGENTTARSDGEES